MATYKRLPVTFVKGEGCWLWDTEGKRYLDALSGIAVCGLGHAHPEIAAALCDQASQLVHTSNLYGIAHQEELGSMLARVSKMDRVFFSNSGAEANEAAIKLARLHGRTRQIESPAIVVAENSFHGRTLATLTATGNRKVQAGFEPLVQGFVRVPYGEIEALRAVAQNNHNVVAVLLEPVQGEGGINLPPDDYLAGIRRLCDDHDWLMMLDEIQSGMARTGRMFAHQHNEIIPDVMTLAKGLGNGVPVGACLAHGRAADLFGPGSHGSTFGGNPLVCRAAITTLQIIERDNLTANAASMGQHLRDGFQARLGHLDGVADIRNHGLMIGIELARPCGELVQQALDAGLLINVTADRVVRLLPPLVITPAEADPLVAKLSDLIEAFLAAD